MKVAKIDVNRCEKCAVCNAMLACPVEAITHIWAKDLQHNGPVIIDENTCLGCAKCERVCRGAAIYTLVSL